MTYASAARLMMTVTMCAGLAACGMFGGGRTQPAAAPQQTESTIWDLFGNRENPNFTVGVNKYLWNASLDVLNFLPVQTIDPYTGVIQTGYGTPPGGGRAYRATIKISDPALDARSLKLSLQGPGGAAVEPGTVRAVEDAILTRARQLRIQDGRL
ncbi:DUF3576 domain-containing protein [Paracoccus sp. (in: a-proteobacteria)]|uniref:DUF3576 domain-containing protein n=1 Tax=Paracoccus sp. TaxID=267 RepID=UPI0026DFA863|nr:DUF3576 domain-containing protein [Paracoccus sp. (in: a-proteobacteria)]MDO5648603.1 DUF3576 domain-containing protein [Paracoccus sp. (in: a-proteobacteria)]